MEQHLIFDVTRAPQSGWGVGRVATFAFESAMILTLPVLLGLALIDYFHQPLAGGVVLALGLIIWAWRNFVQDRANRKIRAYGLKLSEIRSALASYRAGAAKFRGGWLFVNLAAAIAVLPLLSVGGDLYHLITVVVAGSLVLNGFRLWSDQSGVRKTTASYVLVALIWSGALAVLLLVVENFESGENGGPGVLLLLTFAIAVGLTRRVWTISRASLEEMRTRDRRGPVLFLRSFGDEDKVERLLKNALRPYGPFVGIGKPGELRPDGAARTYFSGEAWRPAIVEMMNDAAVLLVMPGLTPGLDWELQRVAEGQRLSKAIFVFLGSDRALKLERLHRCLEGSPEGDQLKSLDLSGAWAAHVGKDGRWITIKSSHDSVFEIQAGLDVALYGVLAGR